MWQPSDKKPTAQQAAAPQFQSWNRTERSKKQESPPNVSGESWGQLQREQPKSESPKLSGESWGQLQAERPKSESPKLSGESWGQLQRERPPKSESPNVSGESWGQLQRERPKSESPKLSGESWGQIQEEQPKSEQPNVVSGEWGGLSGVLPPISIREFRGETALDPFSIADEYASRSVNFTTDSYPALKVRSGFAQTASGVGNIVSLGSLSAGNLLVFATDAGQVRSFHVGSSTLATIYSSPNGNRKWTFCTWKGSNSNHQLIAANGVDGMLRTDGTTFTQLTNAPANANFVDQHDNRLYCAVKNTLHYSALRKDNDWQTAKDAGQIVVENPSGEEMNGLKAGAGHIIVFFPSAMYELWGTGPRDFRMQQVSADVGVLNNQCAVTLNGIVYFFNKNGLYRYAGGTKPDNGFSKPMQAEFAKINNTQGCSIGSDGKKLYMALATTASAWADTVLVYDPEFDVWHRQASFGGSNSVTGFTLMQGNMYQSRQDGLIYCPGTGASDNGTSISWDWISKPFSAGSMAQKLQWYRLWYTAEIPPGSNADVYVSPTEDGNDWELVRSVPTDKMQLHSGRININIGQFANAQVLRVRLRGNGPASIHEITRQQREMPLV